VKMCVKCEGFHEESRARLICLHPLLQAIEAEKQAKVDAEEREKSKKKVFGMVKPVSTLDKLRSTLVAMKKVCS